MKIIEFRAENVKNLKVVEIKPDGTAIYLTGKNGAGKSAILEAIEGALTGKTIEQPIRQGEERAETIIDLGEYTIRKIYTGKTPRLEVRNKDGFVSKSPQALLNELIGKISFDPLGFLSMGPGKQRDLLLRMIGLDLTPFHTERQATFDERADINRQIKKLEGSLSLMTPPAADIPETEESLRDQLDKVTAIEAKRDTYVRAVEANEQQEKDIEQLKEKRQFAIDTEKKAIEDVKIAIAELEEKLKEGEQRLGELEHTEPELPHPIVIPEEVTTEQVQAERDKVEILDKQNAEIREAAKYRQMMGELTEAKKSTGGLTQALEGMDKRKEERVMSCKFPIEGLSVDDTAVIFKGIQINRLSDGQKIRVSTAIAMALNPKLKVILIKDGSSLDSEGLKSIVDMAKDADYQIWIEKVDESGKMGVFIEAGEIKAIN